MTPSNNHLRPGDRCLVRVGHRVYEGKVHPMGETVEYVGDDGYSRFVQLTSVRVVPATYEGLNAMIIQLVALEEVTHQELVRVRELRDKQALAEGL